VSFIEQVNLIQGCLNELSSKKKEKYRTSNWREYNRSLVNRGSITFWFSKDVTDSWYLAKRTAKKGRQETYSDNAIRCGLMIKVLFRIPFRMLEGFISSLLGILGLELSCPDYSIFCRRARNLKIPMRRLLKTGEHLNVILEMLSAMELMIPSIAVRRSMIGVEGRSFLRIRMQNCREESPYLLYRNEIKRF